MVEKYFLSIYLFLIINLLASRKNNKKSWNLIRQAVYKEAEKCQEFLLTNKINTVAGCVNMLIDETNYIYHLPNFVINDPYLEKELCEAKKNENETLNVYMYDLYENKKIKVNLNFFMTGIDLKNIFKKNCLNGDENNYKIRLLFGGSEIKDEQTLSQHKVEDGYTIQVMKNKIIE
jgi:hypothetical protein